MQYFISPRSRCMTLYNIDNFPLTKQKFHVLRFYEAIFAIPRLYRKDVLALSADENYNRTNRHAAYGQFILRI